MVRCFSQDGKKRRDFDFAELTVSPQLQAALAVAFAQRTGPKSGLTRLSSMNTPFRVSRNFSNYLAQLAWPPTQVEHVAPEHLDGFLAWRSQQTSGLEDEMREIKTLLLLVEGISAELVVKCREPSPRRVRAEENRKQSYSRDEFKRIADAARSDLRTAAARIRVNRERLARYRVGELADPDRRLELLDFVERHGDVPRKPGRGMATAGRQIPMTWVQLRGTIAEAVSGAHLTVHEAMAGVILLGVMTGENPSVLLDTPSAHHRADGYAGGAATAIVDAVKPRRGRRAYMNLAMSQVPDWISIPEDPLEISARDELHTPFGVYALMHELTAASRRLTGSDKLFLAYHITGGGINGRGLRSLDPTFSWYSMAKWSELKGLRAEPDPKAVADGEAAEPKVLQVRLDRIRLTYLELHQVPVAHTEQTLVSDYLGRNRGNRAEYQKVVADALAEEVGKARARGVMATLSKVDLEAARTDPESVAAAFGVDAVTLKKLVEGQLDTVMNGCVDNENSPNSPTGQPCRASFMQCLGCPCARALPKHLPIQTLVHDTLEDRRAEMTPLSWTRRFALPHAQLADLIGKHDDADVEDARDAVTDADRAVVARFLNRELDLR
ncbi:hypothetical protein [Prescottella equi]|uniref:hypothetical protein n=1 Tax=Rhodococcus hoagii TaxID=43767 RepID=UPI000A22DCA0|nr:hypothetical protein [Prescottella equi]ORL76876.1 hypothetical protein A5905_18105 [Prescottella equi]